MLRAFCFDTLGVTVEDLYLRDPDPERGGDERGVRVELRLLEPQPWHGSPNAAQRVVLDRAVWRADFLESVAGGPGTKDRMHHHPGMSDSEPGGRVFDETLTRDPMGWLRAMLDDVTPLLEAAKVDGVERHRASAGALRDALHEVVGVVATTLGEVRAGTLATTPTR
ncbi:hypothetical protein [Actinomadura kijaniata]|uniref:hypothetical protein n=1 Tax=Actinomadura kijaniata TaxID=46161 RepID=UPI0008323BB0|nr:hypothetical protein [Actinomadura kijaniata]